MHSNKKLWILALVSICALALHAALPFLLWLPSASRQNKFDAKSPLFFPTNTPLPLAAAGTSTMTKTTSPTLTVTSTRTPTAMPGSPTDSPTPSPSYSVTPLASPSYTFTPGPVAGWPTVYDGDTVPLGGNFYSAGPAGGVEVTSPGNGAGGSNVFSSITVASTAYSSAGVFTFGYDAGGLPIYKDVTTFNSLSISVRVPSSGGNCMVPGVTLATYNSGSGISSTTAAISVETYLVGGPRFVGPDTWFTALVPVSAFLGYNGSSITITSTDLMNSYAVEVQPANYGPTGVFSGAVDVDAIVFNNNASSVAAGNRSGLFADFENGTADNWGGYWSTNADAWTATDCPGYSTPPAALNLTAITYGGVTDTAGAAGTNTPCHDGHLAGWLGAENGPYGSPACSNSAAYPYINMAANLSNDGSAHSLADNSFISTLPPTGATGFRIKLKLGASYPGQVYKIFIEKTSANQGDQFSFQVADSSLSTSAWTSFDVPFPTGPVATRHLDQASEGTVQFWKKTQYASGAVPDAFDLSDVRQIGFGPIVRGKNSDLLVDDIEIY